MNSGEQQPPPEPPADAVPVRSLAERREKARHDLRNPIGHIAGFCELLIEKSGAPALDDVRARLQSICRLASQANVEINQHFDAPAGEAGPVGVDALRRLVRDQAATMAAAAEGLACAARDRVEEMFITDLGRIAGAARQLGEVAVTALAFEAAPEERFSAAKTNDAGFSRKIIHWFQIPAADIDRAVRFYGDVFKAAFHRLDNETGRHAFFALDTLDTERTGGELVQSPQHKISPEGVILYLHAPDGVEAVLARVEKAGGKILTPKTSIGENGFIATILDPEGNRIGLHHLCK